MTSIPPIKVLNHLLSSKKIKPNDLPDDSHGIYLLWDHLGRPFYIGETHSRSQNFWKRIGKHISGSVDKSHMFSLWYNLRELFTFRLIQDRNELIKKSDYDVRKKQNSNNAKLVKGIKNRIIKDLCSVTIYPVDREKLSDADYKILLQDIESKVIEIAKEKEYLVDNPIPFEREVIESYALKSVEVLNAFIEQNRLYEEKIALEI